MNPEKLPSFAEDGSLNVVIETPRNSRNKYAFDPESGLFLLRKVMPVGMSFPFDFGFVPGTKGEDGDPLDVLVLMDEPGAVGCLVRCELLGMIEAEQTEDGKKERNDRFVAQATTSRRKHTPKELRDLSDDVVTEIEAFFINYNELAGKEFKAVRRLGSARARAVVKRSEARE